VVQAASRCDLRLPLSQGAIETHHLMLTMSSSVATSPILPPAQRLFDWGLAAALICYLSVSSLMMDMFGWHYGAPGGSFVEKIHPASLMLIALFLASATARSNPLTAIGSTLVQHPNVTVYLAAVGVLVFQAIVILKQPFTTYIDTFLLPAIVFFLLHRMSETRGRTLARVIHLMFVMNALLGIAEFVFQFRLTPFVIEGVAYAEEWRSSALFGHPLSNALMTGCYVLALALGGGRDLPPLLRFAAFSITALSMVAFGGRAASGLLMAALVLLGAKHVFQILNGQRFDKRALFFGLLMVPVVLAVVAVVFEAGYFDRFLTRIVNDEGSAGTRLAMFDLFKHFTWYDLTFGANPDHLQTYTTIYGLQLGIESFWIAMVMNNGLLVSLPFFAALLLFAREVALAAQWRPSVWVLGLFFGVASASLSLSAKTPDFAIIVAVILVLLRRRDGVVPR
jgi:hypothetical protein